MSVINCLGRHRIPLGYWSIPLTPSDTNYTTSVSPYVPGAWPYFLQALSWARNHSIHVIVDLHGAPGSQNGYDNSGQRISYPLWATNSTNVNRTLDYMRYLTTNLAGMIDVIELLNEPAAFWSSGFKQVLSQYWQDGYSVVRAAAGNGIQVMIGDGFLGLNVSVSIGSVAHTA
jgi:glucan 1,3-beta-glucosidase